jgi:hypothetical protein
LLIDLSNIVGYLSAVSSIAVIAGAIFVVVQLRQNAKLIEASMAGNKANASVALLQKITDESFARRRKQMRDALEKCQREGWKEFDDTLDDYEARNFAYIYELIGQLAKEGVMDLNLVRNALQYVVVFDWDTFEPLAKHLMERYGTKVNAFQNFHWLAEETRKHMKAREAKIG